MRLAVVAVLLAATGSVSAVAAAAPAAKPVGSYEAHLPAEGSSSGLVIKADRGVSGKEGTFQLTDFGDAGIWLESGTTIALFVTSAPTSGHLGVVFAGTVTASGITPGEYTTPGASSQSWSATRGAAGGAGEAAVASAPNAGHAAGSYTTQFPNGETGGLSVQNGASSSRGGQWEFISSDSFESGTWVVLGKQFVMGTAAGGTAGTVFVGRLTPSGIGDGTKLGAYAIVGQGVHPWTAAKNITCASTYTVDAVHGKDTNSGTCVAPFKTLTKALGVATSGQSVDVNPGVYDAANGETFPLSIGSGVSVTGDAAGRGTSPLTQVSGEIDLSGAGSSIDGLKIVGLVHVTGANSSVLDSTVVTGGSGTFAGYCVYVLGATGVVAHNDTVSGCVNVGVLLVAESAVQFTEDTITGNGVGLEVSSDSANLGTKGHDGRNVLSCNTQTDLITQHTLLAYGNYWDHVPPTSSTSFAEGGVDIYTGSGAVVNSTFAMLASSPCA